MGTLYDENFKSTRTCQNDQILPVFESETKEINSSRIEFRDTKFVRLPSVAKVGDYKDYSLLFIVKIGTTREPVREHVVTNVFRSKASALEQWAQDPSQFTFEPTYLSVLPILDEVDDQKMIISDGRHHPKLLQYDTTQFL